MYFSGDIFPKLQARAYEGRPSLNSILGKVSRIRCSSDFEIKKDVLAAV